MDKVRTAVAILIFVFSLASCCPNNNDIHPCTCNWPEGQSTYSVICSELDSAQGLEKVTSYFNGKMSLSSISIKDSVFMYIPSDAFRGLKIEKLEISNTSLMALSDTDIAFVGLDSFLAIFRMTGCTFMSEWDWSLLRNLNRLYKLDITDGDLENIEDLGKINIDYLKDVSFEGNRINHVDPKAFSNCKYLRNLSLRRNKISQVKRTMLPSPAVDLINLDLGYNLIESLPDDIFSNMPKLESLVISSNKILMLSEKVFAPVWSQLESFDALGNELRCDCRTTWILSKKAPKKINATCSQPREQKGKNLDSLQSKDLWCYFANKIQ